MSASKPPETMSLEERLGGWAISSAHGQNPPPFGIGDSHFQRVQLSPNNLQCLVRKLIQAGFRLPSFPSYPFTERYGSHVLAGVSPERQT